MPYLNCFFKTHLAKPLLNSVTNAISFALETFPLSFCASALSFSSTSALFNPVWNSMPSMRAVIPEISSIPWDCKSIIARMSASILAMSPVKSSFDVSLDSNSSVICNTSTSVGLPFRAIPRSVTFCTSWTISPSSSILRFATDAFVSASAISCSSALALFKPTWDSTPSMRSVIPEISFMLWDCRSLIARISASILAMSTELSRVDASLVSTSPMSCKTSSREGLLFTTISRSVTFCISWAISSSVSVCSVEIDASLFEPCTCRPVEIDESVETSSCKDLTRAITLDKSCVFKSWGVRATWSSFTSGIPTDKAAFTFADAPCCENLSSSLASTSLKVWPVPASSFMTRAIVAFSSDSILKARALAVFSSDFR
mmetsp:Transcript_14557/g.21246  ORF Transcript_14557/g.21246 Transcript_14557/m.21246 type:complete len:373 (+) Transcript_14557:549-1667(+)